MDMMTTGFEVILKLTNGKFAKNAQDEYIMYAADGTDIGKLADALKSSGDITEKIANDFKASIQSN